MDSRVQISARISCSHNRLLLAARYARIGLRVRLVHEADVVFRPVPEHLFKGALNRQIGEFDIGIDTPSTDHIWI
jgi:hypothetical protein